MRGINNQVWVTSALSNEDVPKALILCNSMRRTFTTRKIAVIASSKISDERRTALDDGFDLVFTLNERKNTAALNMEDFAKAYAFLSLRAFEKCAYLSPTMMALKNCDDIFEQEYDELGIPENSEDTSLFIFKPGFNIFQSLLSWVGKTSIKGSSNKLKLKDWASIQQIKTGFIDRKFRNVFEEGLTLLVNEDQMSLINLLDYPGDSHLTNLEKNGLIGTVIASHWKRIYRDDVLPLLSQPVDFISKEFLYSGSKEIIAVVGMSCRYAGSRTLEEFWNILYSGQDATGPPPPHRWLKEQSTKHSPGAENTNAGFLNTAVDEFDAKFFGISPKEAVFLDPQYRLLHELVWEGLEDACIDPHSLRGTTGSVFMGSWLSEYKDIILNSGNSEFYRTYMGNSIGAAAARISFLLGTTGPSIATESGCSSAMVALHLACRALQNGETNLALTCGVNLLLYPFNNDVMPMAVSPDGHCKTFSEDANGFARAEGGGVLVLKRLPDALKDGDKIWGLIRGSALSQEGLSKSMGTPTVYCESLAMNKALLDADISPEDVSYVEAHGTGTIVGDPMEVSAIAKAYHSSKRLEPLVIGSVKTNVGHTESCSGITSIMKVILAMKHETIPAHRNFSTLNPSIDLLAVPAMIPTKRLEWKRVNEKPRIAGVSSFGITGTNAHIIIQEPSRHETHKPLATGAHLERPMNILKLSTKTEEAMDLLLEKFKKHVEICDDSFFDLCFSANTGRANFPFRTAIIAGSNKEVSGLIEKHKYIQGEACLNSGKICFLFTGHGSQYPGMAKTLYDTSPVFRMYFEHCNDILKSMYNISITDFLWPKTVEAGNEIDRPTYAQISIFSVEYALLKLWESWGVKPDYVLGHSLGEFAAGVCAGALTVKQAIKLVFERSRLIEPLPHGKMLAIKSDQQEVDRAIKLFNTNKIGLLEYAADNSAYQTVLAGDSETIDEFSKFCLNNNMKCVLLRTTHAFHSRHMDPILDAYKIIAEGEITEENLKNQLSCQECGFISGLKGELVPVDKMTADYWVRHTREKVNFASASIKAVELGCRIFLEIGPQPLLSALQMENANTNVLCLPSIKRKENEWTTLLNTLGKLYTTGLEIKWNGIDQFCNRKKVGLPHYPFTGKKFWIDGVQTKDSTIHPLIGSVIQNASSTKLFQCAFDLQNHDYMKDHVIGNKTLFPGAGFLEMCFAAGLATIEGSTDSMNLSTYPMKVENFKITAPFELEETKIYLLQTIVEQGKSNDADFNLNIKIFHKNDLHRENKWIEHVTATFSPVAKIDQILMLNETNFVEIINNPSDADSITQLYDKMSSVGLKFGPEFRSLEKIWRCEDGAIITKIKTPQMNVSSKQHILHPVILDAMIQSFLLPRLSSNMKVKLFVPIRIGQFLWFSRSCSETAERFVYVSDKVNSRSNNNLQSALLLDSAGNILAVMSDVDIIETNVKSLEAVLEQQTCSIPQMWEEVWRPRTGPLQHAHDTIVCTTSGLSTEELHKQVVDTYDKINPKIEKTLQNLETLSYYYILRCLYQCGFKPSLNVVYQENELRKLLNVHQDYNKLFSYYMRVLKDEKIMDIDGQYGWKVVKEPPNLQQLEDLLSPINNVDLVKEFECTELFINVGNNLSEILQKRKSALGILFPDDTRKIQSSSVPEFYKEYIEYTKMADLVNLLAYASGSHCKSHASGKRQILRICEVGAGTGSLTGAVLENLKLMGLEFEYTYTDISPAFFPAAERKLQNYIQNIIFKKLNIEADPLEQGFIPEYYDLVYAADVIHATKNVKHALKNIRMLLKPGGRFELCETTRATRYLTYIFGLLDGFWRFEDYDIRPNHCSLSMDGWKKTLVASGFQIVETFPCVNKRHTTFWTIKSAEDNLLPKIHDEIQVKPKIKTWLLFHHDKSFTSNYLLKSIPNLAHRSLIVINRDSCFKVIDEPSHLEFRIRENMQDDFHLLMNHMEKSNILLEGIIYCWSLDDECTTQQKVLNPFFSLVKSLCKQKVEQGLKLIVLTKCVTPVQYNDLFRFQKSTIWGFIKALQNERSDFKCRCIDIGENENNKTALQIFYEIWNDSREVQVAYHEETRFVPKLIPVKPALYDLKLPSGSYRFELKLPETRSILDLQFCHSGHSALSSREIEIQVKASALNFKDVLNILKPSDDFKDSNAVGFDFAGVVTNVHPEVTKWKQGDFVLGINTNGTALPSHVCTHEEDVIQVPEHMTFTEACTLPAVFITSYYCLIEIAQIKSTDIVLIHTASGGVGLSAIQICKHLGATVFATAGSKRKQNYLRSVGIKNVFNSRTTDFSDEILQLTNGHGVDVVLNSLTGEGFKEASLKSCRHGARFVEMSKLSIWTADQVNNFRPDVKYTAVDLSTMEKPQWRYYSTKLKEMIEDNKAMPIPHTQFSAVNIREALQYLQKAKHIGKVVVVMPEFRDSTGGTEMYTPLFNSKSTYIITGGLGGVGFEVCKWMVKLGAKYIILAGRNAPNAQMEAEITQINSETASKIRAVLLEVSCFDQCKHLVKHKIPQLGYPTVRGIMHAAGTLNDGLIENQSWDTLSSTFDSKVYGTYNLHELTKHNPHIEHFVLFSSMASLFGSPGQSNHSAGNQFEDTIAHYRYSMGLPATSINWGQWGEVGVATELDVPGLKPISTLQGLTSLEYTLRSQRIQTAVIRVESFMILSKLYPQISMIVDEIVGNNTPEISRDLLTLKSEDYWHQYDKYKSIDDKIEHQKNMLRLILRKILRLDDTDTVEDNIDFQDLGVDSLMFVEIKNCLQALFGDRVTLNVNDLKDCSTIQLLAETLVSKIEGTDSEIQAKQTLTTNED